MTRSSPNGTTSSYSYDDANRLKALDHLGGTTSFARFDYAYNNVSNRTSRTETDSGKKVLDAYNYDPTDQVTGAKYNFNAQANTQDRLVNYAYDAVGNRLELTDEKSIGYATNNLNQYIAVGDDTPTYDLNGNLKSQGIWTYTYDAENRLITASDGTAGYAFTYDARNRCVRRTAPASFKYCYYDGWNLIEELDGNWNLLARYLHGAKVDELVARNEGIAPLYYYADALGNTVALTSGFFGNTPAERYTYDIFGAPTFRDGGGNIIASSAYDNRFLFTGREYLSELGLYDCRHRIYSPDFGRFLQPDPARFGGGDVNLYRYVHNSPMNLWDPLGLCCETEQATYDGAKQTLREAGKLGESAGKRAAEAESTFTMDAGRATVATGIAIGSGWNPVGLVAGGVAAFEWYSAYEDNKTFIEAEGDFKDAGDDIRDRSNELEAAREALADCLSEMGETPDNTDTYRR